MTKPSKTGNHGFRRFVRPGFKHIIRPLKKDHLLVRPRYLIMGNRRREGGT